MVSTTLGKVAYHNDGCLCTFNECFDRRKHGPYFIVFVDVSCSEDSHNRIDNDKLCIDALYSVFKHLKIIRKGERTFVSKVSCGVGCFYGADGNNLLEICTCSIQAG